MNARKVQIDFDEARIAAPVTLHLKLFTGSRSADINELERGAMVGPIVADAIREEVAFSSLLLAEENSVSRPAHAVCWGINE